MTYSTSSLNLGATGRAVQFLQQRLGVNMTSIYDAATQAGVMNAQKAAGLTADGVYGAATNAALTNQRGDGVAIAAAAVGVSARSLRALIAVETNGTGFYSNGLPIIRLERHYVARLCSAGQASQLSTNVCSSTPGGYFGGVAEWDRFDSVARVSLNVAIQSCSWGLGQVMGANWQALRFTSPQAFMSAAALDENAQIRQIALFVSTTPGLVAALNACAWATVARLYNGPSYATYSYDKRLAAAYV